MRTLNYAENYEKIEEEFSLKTSQNKHVQDVKVIFFVVKHLEHLHVLTNKNQRSPRGKALQTQYARVGVNAN